MKRLILFMIGIAVSFSLQAQDGESPISYKSLAIQMSTVNTNGDAQSAVLPSVSSFNGFGGFIENPAVMALSEKSFYSIGWLNQSNDKVDGYGGNLSESDYSNTKFANLGLIYKVPTEKGAFVLGGGYNLISKHDDESFIDAFNEINSITDSFADAGSGYEDIAFNAFATDFRNDMSNEIVSIFRVDDRPAGFEGITQIADISNNRNFGEVSLFAATEFQKNLYVGVSLGFLTGSINYDRGFQELDEQNQYSDGVIPASGSNPATDIYSISLTEELDTDFYGFSARGGVVFKLLPFLNVGGSIALPSKLFVTESYFSFIETEFDDGTFTEDSNDFPTSLSSDFEYAVIKPAEYRLGATLKDVANFDISVSAEFIDYSSTEVDFEVNVSDLELSEIALLREDQEATNSSIRSTYNAVINFKAGASYTLDNKAEIFGGYAIYPGKEDQFSFDEEILSAGVTFPVSENITLDLSGQYSKRSDRSVVYETNVNLGNQSQGIISKEFERFNFLAGLKFSF